jgi:hypothetical protein
MTIEPKPLSEAELNEMDAKETRPEVRRLIAEIRRLQAVMKLHGIKVDFQDAGEQHQRD